ncbi:hypothetical protein DMENIID0001_081740 [Sergentomyia squamirostris]
MMRDRERQWNLDHENRIIHVEDFGEENVEHVDAEWKDFENFLREFRQRQLASASMENIRPRKSRRVRHQAFYPCPPPSMSESGRYDSSSSDDDDDSISIDTSGYINTVVSGKSSCFA